LSRKYAIFRHGHGQIHAELRLENLKKTNILEDFGTGGRIIIIIIIIMTLNNERNGFTGFVIERRDSCCANCNELHNMWDSTPLTETMSAS